jgi:hypothetical protein
VAKSARETPAVHAPAATISPLHLATVIPEADVTLDLQQTFTATYDLLGYDLAIDYFGVPEPALDGAASAIADSLLRMAGLRPA